MSYLGRLGAEMKCLSTLFYFAILGGDSFVLPQMIAPRFSHKAFEIALRVRSVAKQVPADRAVALTYPPHLFHCRQELVSGFRIDSIFHNSYGRTFRNFCIDQYYWFGTIIPKTYIVTAKCLVAFSHSEATFSTRRQRGLCESFVYGTG